MHHPRALHLLLVVAILLALSPHAAWAAQSMPDPATVAAGRRFASVATRASYFPGVPDSFGFGDDIHEPGLGCVYWPSELGLQFLMVEHDDAGYLATVIFDAPIQPLSELNGKPVRHNVKLQFKPPKGDAVVVDLSMTTGELTVKRGKSELSEEEAKETDVGLLADRLIYRVPDTFGIEPNWTVSAVVVIAADGPICDGFPVDFHHTATAPVTVGSLTGEDPAGTITFPSFGVVPGPKLGAPLVSGRMPTGSEIASLHFEQDAQGALVVVLTMNGAVAKVAQADRTGTLTVALNLAAPDFFGVIYPYTIDWIWTPATNPMWPTARVFAPHNPVAVGSVPVTVDGKQIRFAFGGYAPTNLTPPEPDPREVPFGDFAVSFIAPSTLAGVLCICPEEALPAGSETAAVMYEDFKYHIIGNLLSVTRLATGSVAYGWIDHGGRFLAENDEELYRGVIKFVPKEETYDIGVRGIYLEKLDQQPDQVASSGARTVASVSGGNSALRAMLLTVDRTSTRALPADLRALLDLWAKWADIESTDFLPTDAQVENLWDFIRFTVNDPPEIRVWKSHLEELELMKDGPHDLYMPPNEFGNITFSTRSFTLPSAATGSALPFPLPLAAPASEYQPTPPNPDWAIRAGSFFYATEDNPLGEMPALTGPWVDSRLLLAPDPSSGSIAVSTALVRTERAIFSRSQVVTRRSSRRTGRAIRFNVQKG